MKKLVIEQGLTALVFGVVATGLVWGLWVLAPSVMENWERSSYDARMKVRGKIEATPQLLIIARDNESDERFGYGIWDRAEFAKVIQGLGEAGAAVVGIDFQFGDNGADQGSARSDEVLIEATRQAGNVVFPVPVRVLEDHEKVKSKLLDSRVPNVPHNVAIQVESQDVQKLKTASFSKSLLPGLLKMAAGYGHMATMSDPDGVYRSVPSFLQVGNRPLPAFALAIASQYLHIQPDQIQLQLGETLTLEHATFPDGKVQTIRIPVDANGHMKVNYAGTWVDGPFTHLLFVDVWDAITDGAIQEVKNLVEGKIVLIMHAAAESDKRQTPMELNAPGGFIHANMINTILTQQFLHEPSAIAKVAISIMLGAVAAWCVLSLTWGVGLLGIIAMVVAYMIGTVWVAPGRGLILPLVAPLLTVVVGAVAALVWTTRKQEQTVQELEASMVAHQRQLMAAREDVVNYESQVEELEEDLADGRTEMQTSTDANKTLASNIQVLEDQLLKAQTHLQQSRQDISTLQGKVEDLRVAEVPVHTFSDGEVEALSQECETPHNIVSKDKTVLGLYKDLKKAVRGIIPILILGEPGTGKELFARAAHNLSKRAKGPFVPVNMAAIPSELFERELFGHVKGSFTGAVRDEKGFFGKADQGTIFLDEIGDLRLDLQAKLLRVLQDGTFSRVGSTALTKVDVRIVSATNKNLVERVAAGEFREDLYFRLLGIILELPPLRARQNDIAILAERLMRTEVAQLGCEKKQFSQSAMNALIQWPWPGNVRELQKCIQQAVTLGDGPLINEQDLRLQPVVQNPSAMPQVLGNESLDVSGDPALLDCLRQNGFDIQATAKAVNWDRSTVTQRLRGLCFQTLIDHNYDNHAAAQYLAGEQGLVRIVELKLTKYEDHLRKVAAESGSLQKALASVRKRLKNLPERHIPAMETVIKHVFQNNS